MISGTLSKPTERRLAKTLTRRQFNKIQNKTYSEEIHLVDSILELKKKLLRLQYFLSLLLFLTQVLSLEDLFLRNMFYVVG